MRSNLPDGFSGLIRQFSKFGAIGLLSTALYYVLYLLLLNVTVPAVSYLFAYIVSMASGVALNLRFTFEVAPSRRRVALFVLVYLVTMLIGGWVLAQLIDLSIRAEIAGLLTIVVTVLTNFFGLKLVARLA